MNKTHSCDRSEIGANRRAEYVQLRKEIEGADRTGGVIMGFLITITALAGSASIGLSPPVSNVLFWLLSPVYFFGFCYFTEKRSVILRINAYIRDHIESTEDGLNWSTFLRQLSVQRKLRPAFPFDPYHLEIAVCTVALLAVPTVGLLIANWTGFHSYYISSLIIFIVYVALAIHACILYGRPLECCLETLPVESEDDGKL